MQACCLFQTPKNMIVNHCDKEFSINKMIIIIICIFKSNQERAYAREYFERFFSIEKRNFCRKWEIES